MGEEEGGKRGVMISRDGVRIRKGNEWGKME